MDIGGGDDGWMDWKCHIILMKLDLKQIKGKGSFCFSKLELRMHLNFF
jgi:hypothetical protein